ncbi:basic salivary proline-rich protein 3-like [Ornithorhynchus anatinus]|uniref:basic salivary proline-rich protein 3-like n=1 Tax=Ornithorhynchus anatinus TaxID=9258 RepID=UPI0019D47223|nr:basic salivary proline-rich protein 3-like [Ornithorhynchus anatinus]
MGEGGAPPARAPLAASQCGHGGARGPHRGARDPHRGARGPHRGARGPKGAGLWPRGAGPGGWGAPSPRAIGGLTVRPQSARPSQLCTRPPQRSDRPKGAGLPPRGAGPGGRGAPQPARHWRPHSGATEERAALRGRGYRLEGRGQGGGRGAPSPRAIGGLTVRRPPRSARPPQLCTRPPTEERVTGIFGIITINWYILRLYPATGGNIWGLVLLLGEDLPYWPQRSEADGENTNNEKVFPHILGEMAALQLPAPLPGLPAPAPADRPPQDPGSELPAQAPAQGNRPPPPPTLPKVPQPEPAGPRIFPEPASPAQRALLLARYVPSTLPSRNDPSPNPLPAAIHPSWTLQAWWLRGK